MPGEPTDRSMSRSRPRHISARILAILVFLMIVLAVIGFIQGRFASNWLKVMVIIGMILGIGGILRAFVGKEAHGEIINLIAVAIAFVSLVFSLGSPSSVPSAPEPPLSPVEGLLPYTVAGTGELGLLVRICPLENCGCTGSDCNLLGTAGEHSQVWVQCSLDSGYTPPGEPESIWHRIRWSNSSGGTRQFFDSNPDSPHFGWIFSRYITASGPNSMPPSC